MVTSSLETAQSEPKCYVYRHIRLDRNEPFYIGIGTRQDYTSYVRMYGRAFSKNFRGDIWNKIASKTNYAVEIVLDDLTATEAKEKEIELIALYGRKNTERRGSLANMTDGGDGAHGHRHTEATKKIMSIISKERWGKRPHPSKGRPKSEETRRKLSQAMKIVHATADKSNWKKHTSTPEQRIATSIRTKAQCGANNISSKQVININTLEVYPCIREAAEKNNINRGTLMDYLLGKVTNKTPLRKYEDGVIIETAPKKQLRKVINTITGEVYANAKVLSELINVKYTTLFAQLNGQNSNRTIYKWL